MAPTCYSPYLKSPLEAWTGSSTLLLTTPERKLDSDDLTSRVLLLSTNQISYAAN